MPYIEKSQRRKYNILLDHIYEIETKGDLEYCIFKLQKIYMKTRKFKYSNLHDTVYAAQHCSDEFRRRYLDKRENEARKNNGDVE